MLDMLRVQFRCMLRPLELDCDTFAGTLRWEASRRVPLLLGSRSGHAFWRPPCRYGNIKQLASAASRAARGIIIIGILHYCYIKPQKKITCIRQLRMLIDHACFKTQVTSPCCGKKLVTSRSTSNKVIALLETISNVPPPGCTSCSKKACFQASPPLEHGSGTSRIRHDKTVSLLTPPSK